MCVYFIDCQQESERESTLFWWVVALGYRGYYYCSVIASSTKNHYNLASKLKVILYAKRRVKKDLIIFVSSHCRSSFILGLFVNVWRGVHRIPYYLIEGWDDDGHCKVHEMEMICEKINEKKKIYACNNFCGCWLREVEIKRWLVVVWSCVHVTTFKFESTQILSVCRLI